MMTRREFMKRAAALGAATYGLVQAGAFFLLGGRGEAAAGGPPTIIVASKGGPAQLVRAAVEALGGMSKFVKRGASVVVKPNMAWARKPEHAANTNPKVVAEIVRLCRVAGAREVKVIDHPIDRPASVVAKLSGIASAAEAAGAKVVAASSRAMFQRMKLQSGKVLKKTDVLRDIMRADVVINVPIAKVHSTTGVTLSCKNLMGTVHDRGAWHTSPSLDQCIADYAAEVRPDLVILDAIRVLLTNGPKGPGRTEDRNIVVAGTDPVAVDAYGVTLLGRKPQQIGHLRLAHAMGVGELDLTRVKVRHV